MHANTYCLDFNTWLLINVCGKGISSSYSKALNGVNVPEVKNIDLGLLNASFLNTVPGLKQYSARIFEPEL